ncbi:peptidoglycan DD-metalloendopeptidase family protein [Neptunicella marina]|uniref:peptidoglycan DD-metalloendopeptidase family protein n=1 Tax=Neptunicella marina TaxID=2125989 RepID=UPI0030CA3098
MGNKGWLLFTTFILLLGGCSGRPAPAPVISASNPIVINDYKAPLVTPKSVTVKNGDTLYSIAWYYGLDFQTIAQNNKLSSPYNIFPGQKLILLNSPARANKGERKNTVKNKIKQKKINVKQDVDHDKKQAYGESSGTKNTHPTGKRNYADNVGKWVWPAAGKVIATFSVSEQGNKGIDIANRVGSKVVAAASGKVVYCGDALRGYGNLVIIKHTDEYLTAYAHNSKILVKEQQWVKSGQKIALMGSSDSDRVKLHFEVRFKGSSVDPLHYLPTKNNNK